MESTTQFNINGYSKYYNNSNSNRNDGVIVLIKSNLDAKVTVIKLLNWDDFIAMINIKVNNITIGLNSIYKSPRTSAVSLINDNENAISNNLNNIFEIFI